MHLTPLVQAKWRFFFSSRGPDIFFSGDRSWEGTQLTQLLVFQLFEGMCFFPNYLWLRIISYHFLVGNRHWNHPFGVHCIYIKNQWNCGFFLNPTWESFRSPILEPPGRPTKIANHHVILLERVVFAWKQQRQLHSLKLTAILPLKMGDPWKRKFLLEATIFRGELLVLGRVRTSLLSSMKYQQHWPTPDTTAASWFFHGRKTLRVPSPMPSWMISLLGLGKTWFKVRKIYCTHTLFPPETNISRVQLSIFRVYVT